MKIALYLKLPNIDIKVRILLISLLLATACSHAVPTATELGKHREQELTHLLKHDCGSCHGMTLKGGLGPALLPDALANKPDELLFVTIWEGRPGTPMPPWKTQLSEQDVNWLIQQLRKGVE